MQTASQTRTAGRNFFETTINHGTTNQFRANLGDDLVEKMLFIRENKLRDEDIHELTDDVPYEEALMMFDILFLKILMKYGILIYDVFLEWNIYSKYVFSACGPAGNPHSAARSTHKMNSARAGPTLVHE